MPGQLRTIPLTIAAAGMTVDGREITEKDINDIVETYNAEKYGARINIDHYMDMSGYKAEVYSSIELNGGMLGDVIEVTKETNSDGVLVLKAVLAPNASFVQLNQADQHVYFSMEIDRDFCDSGQTYLIGLAVTDYPASCYTSRAHFSKEKKQGNTDVNFLLADLGLGHSQSAQHKKPNVFKRFFTKDESMPLTKDDKAEIGQAVADALTPHFSQLATGLEKFTHAGKPNAAEGEDEQPENTDTVSKDEFTALSEKFEQQTTEFNQLKDEFKKLSTEEADDTTAADDEPTGDDGKYANLL